VPEQNALVLQDGKLPSAADVDACIAFCDAAVPPIARHGAQGRGGASAPSPPALDARAQGGVARRFSARSRERSNDPQPPRRSYPQAR